MAQITYDASTPFRKRLKDINNNYRPKAICIDKTLLTSFTFVAFWIISVRFSAYLVISGRLSVPKKILTLQKNPCATFK